jgi:predicted ATPase/DNA-binding CsgD family transcriptional regulator
VDDRGTSHRVFIGREPQLLAFEHAVRAATHREPYVLTVSGEPGIGKSSLLDQFSTVCTSRGARVCRAQCWDGEGSPEYWPWLQVGNDLSGWAPEQARVLWSALAPDTGDDAALPASQVHRFDAVVRSLEVSADRPLVVMFDDLHWADAGTLALARFLVGAVRDWPLVLVLAYRDTEPNDDDLQRTVAAAGRARNHRHLQLDGLPVDEVADLMRTILHLDQPPEALVRRVTDAANGNPLYVSQLLQRAVDDPSFASGLREGELTPKGPIIDVILDRVRALPDGCRESLEVASVIGRQFEAETLPACGVDATRAAGALDAAERAGLLLAPSSGTWLFAHDVIRSVLYEQLGSARRAQLHAAVAVALERSSRRDADAATLAHHLARAGTLEGRRRARTSARIAARHAASRSAHRDAARFYAWASELGEGDPVDADALEEAIGESRSRFDAGELRAARVLALRAVDIARSIDDAVGVADAAICLSRPGSRFLPDLEAIAIVRDALARLPKTERTRHLMLAACLCWELQFDDAARARELSARLLADARELGDPNVITYAFIARRYAIWSAADVDELTTIADELVELGSAIGEPELEAQGHFTHRGVRLDLGDLAGADASMRELARLADRYQLPGLEAWVAAYQGLRHALHGDLASAEAALDEALLLSASTEDDQVLVQFVALQVVLARERLQLDVATDLVTAAATMRPTHPLMKAGALHVDLLAKRSVDPRRLGQVVDGCGDGPTDWLWLAALAEAACCTTHLDDAAAARRLHSLLSPFSLDRKTVTVGATVCLGSVGHFAGLCAVAMGDPTQAEEHFAIALEVDEAIGARPQLARTHLQMAKLARLRQDDGDAERHVATARVIGEPLAIPLLDREFESFTGRTPRGVAGLTPRESQVLALVVQGLTNRRIAGTVHVSEKTVERHLGHVYAKLGVRNRAEASAWAVRNLPDEPT